MLQNLPKVLHMIGSHSPGLRATCVLNSHCERGSTIERDSLQGRVVKALANVPGASRWCFEHTRHIEYDSL